MFVFNDFRHDARVLKEARSLSGAGYSVRVFALHKPGLPEREAIEGFEVERIALNPWHLRLIRRLSAGRPPAPKSPSRSTDSTKPVTNTIARAWARFPGWMGPLRQTVRARLRPAVVGAARRVLMPWHRSFSYLDFYRRVHARLRNDAFEVLHCHDLNTLPVVLGLGRGRAVVYDSHELYVDRNRIPPRSWLGRRLTRWIEKRLLSHVDLVITVNESIAEILARRYRIPTPTVVMNAPVVDSRSPADPIVSTLDLRTICGIPAERPLLLYTGGITFHRGLDRVIESLGELPQCHFVLMGPGRPNMIEQLTQIADRHGVGERVHFVDPVPSDQVAAVAASADIGIAPIENACLSYYLCSPNKLFEYLHAGLPVAASAFPELMQVLETHDCGMTFDPSEPSSITACVRDLLSDRPRLQQMAANAARAAERFNWEKEAGRLLEAYGRLRVSPSPGTPA